MSQKVSALLVLLQGFACSLLSEAAFAQENSSDPNAAATARAAASPSAAADAEPSKISAELGLGLRKGFGPELRLNWFKDEDMVLGLKVGQYAATDIAGFDRFDLLSMALVSRFSLDESFFVEGGLDFTQVKSKINSKTVDSGAGTGSYAYEGSVQQSYMILSLGNQWQTGMWTFGGDWVDLYIPFKGSISSKSSGSSSDVEARERNDEKALKTEAWNINYGFSIHAGLVF